MRKLFVAVVVVLLLGVAADRVGASLAAQQIEQRVREETGQEATAAVNGFPFLTQVLGRKLAHVRLTSDSATLPGEDLKVTALRVDLRGVGVQSEPRAERLEATGVVPFAEVERHRELPAGSLSASPDGRLRISQHVDLLNESFAVAGTAAVRVDGDQLVVEPDTLAIEGSAVQLDAEQRGRLAERLRFQLPLDDVPAGTRVDDVRVVERGLQVHLTGRDVLLSDL
jgi:hypothetical protein